MESVAIVVPLSNRNYFTPDEQVSLAQLNKHLNQYDRYLITPPDLQVEVAGFGQEEFPDEYFGSAEAHARLLLTLEFYDRFSKYEYILIYHLDALVFSNELKKWCSYGYDYVAPPWVEHPETPYYGNKNYEGNVGNGGFSLRRVTSFARVLRSRRFFKPPFRKAYHTLRSSLADRNYKGIRRAWQQFNSKHNGIAAETRDYIFYEDHFWGTRAVHYWPEFKVAPLEVALSFAFEAAPEYCFQLNGHKLPFGCHAWDRYDRTFWERYL